MPRQKKVTQEANGAARPKNKMAAVKAILRRNGNATGSEIAGTVKSEFDMDITPKQAGKYRYLILRGHGKRRGGSKPAVAAAATGERRSAGADPSGYDDLLRAAQKLGWRRVKTVVDQVLQAPA